MPDSRAKPLEMVQGHRTKAEIKTRQQNEERLRTGENMRPSPEVKANESAMKAFRRLKKIFASVEMDEAFYEGGLSRYCLMLAEHEEMLKDKERLMRVRERVAKTEFEDQLKEWDMLFKAESAVNDKDKAIAKLRDQMLQFERENLMTVQGKLRAVPKKPEQKKPTGIEAYMQRRANA